MLLDALQHLYSMSWKKKDLSLQSGSGENQQELGTVKESNSSECDCNTLDTHQN